MLLRLFKGFMPTNLVAILLFAVFFWARVFFDTTNPGIYIDQNPMLLYKLVMDFFISIDIQLLNKLVAFLLVLLQAFIVVAINNHFNLLGYRSYMPAFFFVLITANFTNYMQLQPILFANTLFLFAWIRMKKAKGKQNALANYFDASLLIGLASLFYFNFIYLVIILLINILISRPGNLKEIGMAGFGVVLIWYLFFMSYYIADSSVYDINALLSFEPGISDFMNLSLSTKIADAFFLLLVLISSLALFKYYNSLNINIRINLKLFFYLFVVGILLIYLTNSSYELVYLIAIPVSLFLSLFFMNVRSKLFADLLLFLALLLSIINLYFSDFI